jgi:hypothetical protein
MTNKECRFFTLETQFQGGELLLNLCWFERQEDAVPSVPVRLSQVDFAARSYGLYIVVH